MSTSPNIMCRLFELPLISSTWEFIQNKYRQQKEQYPLLKYTLIVPEQTTILINKQFIQPIYIRHRHKVNDVDTFLCHQLETIKCYCPILQKTKDQELDKIIDIDALYYLLCCLKLLILNDECLETAAKDNRGFLTYCLEKLLVHHIWKILSLGHDHLNECCVPLLLHALSYESGKTAFSAYRYVMCALEIQLDTVISDRSLIIHRLSKLYLILLQQNKQQSTTAKGVFSWEFFLNRFDTLSLESQINLEESGDIVSPQSIGGFNTE
ncbi:unnamed protein product [Didymodactylos carnosus]|uniref:Uncharacterized protein n=1 Tax=Didymodactylos carnosus TaxID=1234261 RepID=A0A814M8X0_9BILA|nr:unnamed protein product [Didymodactylos carnosus]CAF3841132.1 unnamed protein product [Didymodactylos carnosus]